MRQNHVVVHYKPWRETQWVDAEDAWVLVCYGYEINGHRVPDNVASLTIEGPFFSIRLEVPEGHPDTDEDLREKNRLFHERCIAAVRDELTEDDWLEETTDDVLVLPVGSIEIVQAVRPKEYV